MYSFFQAEDGIRDRNVTGVQTCALPISEHRIYQTFSKRPFTQNITLIVHASGVFFAKVVNKFFREERIVENCVMLIIYVEIAVQIGRASCRERVKFRCVEEDGMSDSG